MAMAESPPAPGDVPERAMQPHSIVLPTPPLNQDLRLQVRVVDLHFQAILVRDARRDPTDLFEVVLTPTPSRIQQLRYGRSSLQAGMKKNPEIGQLNADLEFSRFKG